MSGLRIPDSWVEEYCRSTEPELFEASRAERTRVCLSHPEKARWQAEYGLDEVAQDLADGMTIEAIDGKDGRYYRLTGRTLDVFARPRSALESGVQQGYVTAVKPAQRLGRIETIRPLSVGLAVARAEEPCDLAELEKTFAEGLRIVRQRRSLRERARRGLTRTGVAARPRGDLHGMVRRYYQPLIQMLELLEQRSKHEDAVRGYGVAVGEDEVRGQRVLWLRLAAKAGFAEGRTVAVTGAETTQYLRVAGIQDDDEGQLLAIAAPHPPVALGDRLELEQQGRFALGKHSGALRAFLNEQVEGDWEHLALLLCFPERLPLITMPPARSYFDLRLNQQQRAAVDGAIGSPHTFHVQGPPGTGKSTVITEVVRQLAARGERVLLLAPMHVAVDEVMGRLVDKPGILALRIAGNESKVAPELREYLPERAARTYLERVRRPATSQADRWRIEIGKLHDQYDAVTRFLSATARYRQASDVLRAARSELARWRADLAAALAERRAEQSEAERALAYVANELPAAAARVQALLAQVEAVSAGRRFWAEILAAFGAASEVGQLSAAYRQAEAEHRRLAEQHRTWTRWRDATSARIRGLDEQGAIAGRGHQATIDRAQVAATWAQKDMDATTERLRSVTGHDPTGVAEETLTRWQGQLATEVSRREHRIRLEQRWFELSGLVGGSEDALAKQVEADLRRSANLVCCTTAGITGDLGDSDFDTLIVDEASRVVDSEFLIGAVRARRWVLVGDEHQLPPYVEPDDEQHLHALSALRMVDRGVLRNLEAAVDHLGKLWIEDEDLHRFRNDAVLRTAENLRDTGIWEREYRGTFDAAWQRLRDSGEDAERTLLSAMLAHQVRSLFERSVGTAPKPLRQRLVVQRRMIAPIAELVRKPVYGGDYETPANAEVEPLPYGGTNTPVVFVDTSVYGERAKERYVGTGVVNDLEADLIARMCRSWDARLRRLGGGRVKVGVLTFYRRQASEIEAKLGGQRRRDYPALDFGVIDTIDKIQGQESDLVFISFCRTFPGNGKPSARYGRWLQDIRRLNVACTRARRALVLVGHLPTLRKLNGVPAAEQFYRNLFTLLAERSDMEIAKDIA